MKRATTWAMRLALPWLVVVLVLVYCLPTAQAAYSDIEDAAPQAAVDIDSFFLEITTDGVSYATINGADYHSICMEGEDGGYLYGFYRQNLDWSGQAGVCLTVSNDSESELRLVLQLMDADWQSIEIPDGTPVFLQETGAGDVVVAFASLGAVSVPAGFTGEVQVPLIGDDEILSSLEGLGFTFVPQGTSTATLYGITFWGEATALHYQSLGTLGIGIDDASLLIPQTGYSMTSVSVQGVLENQTVTYAISGTTTGVSVDEAGRVWVDATASTGTVTVQAVVDGQYVLEISLALTSVWDVKPEDMLLAEFTIIDPPGNAQPTYVQVFLWWTEHLTALRVLCILLGLALPCIYLWWRVEAKE